MASTKSIKYKNIYCDHPRPNVIYHDLRLSTATGEQNYIKANSLYFAVGIQGGGGPLAVINLDKPGRMSTGIPAFTGHSGAVNDFDFNPFNDAILASGSDDNTVKVWEIPEGGLTKDITAPVVNLQGHLKKVTLLRFHPTTANIVASVSADLSVRLWDIEKAVEMSAQADAHTQLMQDIVFDYLGSNYATSSGKAIRIFDARTQQVTHSVDAAHEGTRSVKLTFLGGMDKLMSVRFTRTSQRQIKIWDPRNMSQENAKLDIDTASGVLMPFYDVDTSVLYLAGKGDGNVRYFEIVNDSTMIYPINDYRSTVAAKGIAMVPKRGLNIMGCETARLLKLTTNTVEPLSFIVPRKVEGFQEDIFPDTASGEPSQTADEWFAGTSNPPKLMSLNPADGDSSKRASMTKAFSVRAISTASLLAELDKANSRIKELEERLAAAGLSSA